MLRAEGSVISANYMQTPCAIILILFIFGNFIFSLIIFEPRPCQITSGLLTCVV